MLLGRQHERRSTGAFNHRVKTGLDLKRSMPANLPIDRRKCIFIGVIGSLQGDNRVEEQPPSAPIARVSANLPEIENAIGLLGGVFGCSFGMRNYRRAGKVVAHQSAPFLEVRGLSEAYQMIIDRVPANKKTINARVFHHSMERDAVTSFCTQE